MEAGMIIKAACPCVLLLMAAHAAPGKSPARKSNWNLLQIRTEFTGHTGTEEHVKWSLVSKLQLWETQRTRNLLPQEINLNFKTK